jgi:xylulokinase
MYLIGYDVGSSFIKATLLDAETGKVITSATSPNKEMQINAPQPGWAEQHPEVWWENIKLSTKQLKSNARIDMTDVKAIGISYQMHGLVIVDKNKQVLRPSIIWCDSRAVNIGDKATVDIGKEKCLNRFLNFPGNFTASKLKWVKNNEPDIYNKIYKAMLPGDYIAMKMSGEICTTPSGLSEGILWDFHKQDLADIILDYYGFSSTLIPKVVPTFSIQGELTKEAADELGLKSGTKITYRAGDQPNNALSLNVLNPGELATTAGTSGVIYGVSDEANYDVKSRVNTFVHVNHQENNSRYGVLLCINGTGILNRWTKENFMSLNGKGFSYEQMNDLASKTPVGSDGLVILPFGNGAERTLENKDIGASVHNLNFNVHDKSHFLRATQEGIVFAFNYGVEIMKDMGIKIENVRAGNANMFLSPLFGEAFATVTSAQIELLDTDGAQGAARGAGIGIKYYKNQSDAFIGLNIKKIVEPKREYETAYQDAYYKWLEFLKISIERK